MTLLILWLIILAVLYVLSHSQGGDYDFTSGFLSFIIVIAGFAFTLGWWIGGCR